MGVAGGGAAVGAGAGQDGEGAEAMEWEGAHGVGRNEVGRRVRCHVNQGVASRRWGWVRNSHRPWARAWSARAVTASIRVARKVRRASSRSTRGMAPLL